MLWQFCLVDVQNVAEVTDNFLLSVPGDVLPEALMQVTCVIHRQWRWEGHTQAFEQSKQRFSSSNQTSDLQ